MPLQLTIRNFLLNLTEQELAGRDAIEPPIESTILYFFVDDRRSPHYGQILEERRTGEDRRQTVRLGRRRHTR